MLHKAYQHCIETKTVIAAKIGRSVKDTKEIIRAGIDSTHYIDFYRKYADEDGKSTAEDVTIDTTSNPEILFLKHPELQQFLSKKLIQISSTAFFYYPTRKV